MKTEINPTARTPMAWRQLKWSLPFFIVFLPVVLLTVYALQIASYSVQALIEAENIAATSNLSQHLTRQFTQGVSLVNAVASGTGTVAAIKEDDTFVLDTRLKFIVASFPQIERAFITNKDGVVIAEYPKSFEYYGKDVSHLEWFAGIEASQKTYVSGVYTYPEEPNEPVVALAAPVNRSGYLVFEYQARQLSEWIDTTNLSGEGYIFVIDHQGRVVSHPGLSDGDLSRAYAKSAPIVAAQNRLFHTTEYRDPLRQESMIATFLPIAVGSNHWVVVAQQPTASAYKELNRVTFNISLAGAILSIFTLFIVVALARMSARNIALNLELKEKNRILRETASIVRSSADAILGVNLNGTVRSWNKGAKSMYGYKESEMLDKPFLALIYSDEGVGLNKLIEKAKKGTGSVQQEMVHSRKNGEDFPVSLTLSPIHNEDGDIEGFSAIIRDITERKEIEQMKSDFISFVSHQLKAPITAIKWMIESMLDGDDGAMDDGVRETIGKLKGVNESNHKLVTDILNASRIERGVVQVVTEEHPLMDAVEQAVRDYRVPMKEAGLTLKILEKEKGIMVHMDTSKIAEAISNSVSNAIKYTEKGGITITLSTEKNMGVVEVTDTGKGMDKEMLKKMFTRDKVMGSNTKAANSSGLGLYIAKHFVQLQGGDITVSSTVGEGTTFRYTVPLSKSKKSQKKKKK